MTFRRIDQIDTVTGEIIGNALIVVPKKYYNAFVDGWVAMAQPALDLLADSDLTGEELKVLLKLLGRLDFENFLLINQSELAKSMGIQRTNVNRSIRRLLEMEILLEGPKVGPLRTYRLNPTFGWKGSAKNHQNVVKLDKKKASKAPKKED
jgi:hypothetical protein